jgi:serine/threonine protein kinase
MAEGLEAAHERAIVHRALKPGNVKVTPEGRVKLLPGGTRMMVAPVEREGRLRVGRPRVLFDGAPTESFEISPDGKWFLTMTRRTTKTPLELRVVFNWLEDVERLVPHPRR